MSTEQLESTLGAAPDPKPEGVPEHAAWLHDALPQPALLVSAQGKIVRANRAYCQRFDTTGVELEGAPATVVAGPYGSKMEGRALLRAIEEGSAALEMTCFDSSGMAFPSVVTVTSFEEPVCESERLVTILETSEMHRLKATLSVVEQTARREKQLLQAVAEPLDDLVIALDDAERVVLVNESARHGFALPNAGARGRSLIDLELPGSIRGVWLAFLATNEADATKTVRTSLSGTARTIRLLFRRARSQRGAPLGSVMIATALPEAATSGEIRAEPPAPSLCHDLRTRLASIHGFATALVDDPGIAETTRTEFVTIIASETEKLDVLLERLLASLNDRDD